MLLLTENATTVVRSIGASPELPDGAGLRIANDAAETDDLSVSAVASPAEDDVVVEEGGARVFLDQDAAQMLEDKVLDARVGDDGDVEFLLAAQ